MKDYRNRTIQYKDGKRVLYKPKKKIEACFELQTLAFEAIENIPIEKNIFNEWNKQYVMNQQHGK